MRRMLERISPVLLVSVLAGGFVVMSSFSDTAESAGARKEQVEPPNGVRPTAALSVELSPEYQPIHSVDQLLTDADRAYITAAIEAASAPPPPRAQTRRDSAAASSNSGGCDGDVECFLACTRAHESDTAGGYEAVSSGGSYRGAYQFQQSTWDAAVAGAGYDQYAGVPADEVPGEVQDAAAAHLYSVSGTRPWGGRC